MKNINFKDSFVIKKILTTVSMPDRKTYALEAILQYKLPARRAIKSITYVPSGAA